MEIKALLLILFVNTFCFSQSSIGGFIYDKQLNEPLPYATIKIISSTNYYTITNEDGKFEINDRFSNDSIEVSFIGFKTKKIAISYFKSNEKLYLAPNVFALNTVVVVAEKEKDYSYKLLNRLIQKYRNKQLITESKAFLTLTSSVRGIPIEIIEGFYNSEQNLADGIIDLEIKSGRFGQNKSFPFYSLNNTDILKDFQLFENSTQILPKHPGNLAFSTIKNKYYVKIDDCISCSIGDMSITFVPKKSRGNLFSGTIIFDKEGLIIKKINLICINPITNNLTSIIEHDEITPKEIKLAINFNPTDFEKIQSVDFKFSMYYKSISTMEIIESNSFLYFYDYNKSFIPPYFTNNIKFNNDYDKIIALQASEEFWNANYQFPKSFNEKRAINYFKESGFLINYENSIPLIDVKYTKPSVVVWDKNKRLEWSIIKQNLTENEKIAQGSKAQNNINLNEQKGKAYYSRYEMDKDKSSSKTKEFNFSYLLDEYIDEDGSKKFVAKTIFDRNSSFCTYERTLNRLVYINLIFDIYEYYLQDFNTQIVDTSTFDELKMACKAKFDEATVTVKKMQNETNYGLNFQSLIKWNNKIKAKLNIDNYKLIINKN